MCLGSTSVTGASARASNGLPTSGSPSAPIQAIIPANPGNDGFRLSNGLNGNPLKLKTSEPMVSLDTSVTTAMPSVINCSPTGPTTTSHAGRHRVPRRDIQHGDGLRDRPVERDPALPARRRGRRGHPHHPHARHRQVRTGAVGHDGRAQRHCGLHRLDLLVDGERLLRTGRAVLHPDSDPLAGVSMSQSVGQGLTLGDYIASWKSSTTTDIKQVAAGVDTLANVPGAVSITTQQTKKPTRRPRSPSTSGRSPARRATTDDERAARPYTTRASPWWSCWSPWASSSC